MIKKFWKLSLRQKALLPAWPVFYAFFLAKYGLGALWIYRFFIYGAAKATALRVNQIYRAESETGT